MLQVLALDIGTDMLPALALGAEPANERTMDGPRRTTDVVDGRLLRRALLVLGPTEALLSMAAFLTVLTAGGWSYGDEPLRPACSPPRPDPPSRSIALGQIANAFACRSETRPAWRVDPRRNPLLLGAVAVEAACSSCFLGVPWSPTCSVAPGPRPRAGCSAWPPWWRSRSSTPATSRSCDLTRDTGAERDA